MNEHHDTYVLPHAPKTPAYEAFLTHDSVFLFSSCCCCGQAPKRVAVAVDDSPMAAEVLEWALSHVLGPHDFLHIVCVAPPTLVATLDEPGACGGCKK